MPNSFTFQLKEFKKIVSNTDLARHEDKRIVYVSNNTLIAFNTYFLLKFRLDNFVRCPKNGFHYLSKMSLSSDPIEEREGKSYWQQNLNFYLNQIEWGEFNSIPGSTWEDFDNCRVTAAAGDDPGRLYHKQIAVFQQSDRSKIQIAGIGDSTVYYDPKSFTPWQFYPDNILRLSPLARVKLGRHCFYRDESINARISVDNKYVQFNSSTVSLTLPATRVKTDLGYHDLLSLMPKFDELSSDIDWCYNDRAYIYQYHPDGYCYVINQDFEAIDSFAYTSRNRHCSLTKAIYLRAEKLHSFTYRGLTLALNLGDKHPKRTHGLLKRSRVYRPPTVAAKLYKVERRQKAEGRGQKDRLAGDSDSPLNVDYQNKVFGGGFKPKKVEGERTAEPACGQVLCAICPSSAASSAFQGGSLGNKRVDCIHYDTRILGCIADTFVSDEMIEKIEASKIIKGFLWSY